MSDDLSALLGSKSPSKKLKGKAAPDPLERAVAQVMAGTRLLPSHRDVVRLYLSRHRNSQGQIRPEAIAHAQRQVRQGPMGVLSLDFATRVPPPPKKVVKPPQPVSRELREAMATIDRESKGRPLSSADRATARAFVSRRQAPDGYIHPKVVTEAAAMAKQGPMGVSSLRHQNRHPNARPETFQELEDSLRFTRDALEKVFHSGNGATRVPTKDGKYVLLRDAIDQYLEKTGQHFESRGDRYASEDAVRMYTADGAFADPETMMRHNGGRPYEQRIQKDLRLYGPDYVYKGILFPLSYAHRKLRGDSVTKKELDAIEKKPLARFLRNKVREPLAFASGALGTAGGLVDFVDMATGQGGRKGESNGFNFAAEALRDRKTEEGIDLPFNWGGITTGDVFSTGGAATASFIPGMGVGRLATAARLAPAAVRFLSAAANAGAQAGSNAGSSYREAVDSGVAPSVARERALEVFPADLGWSVVTGKIGGKGKPLVRAAKSVGSEMLEEGGQQILSNAVVQGKLSGEGVPQAMILAGLFGGAGAMTGASHGSSPTPKPRLLSDEHRSVIERSRVAEHPLVQKVLQEDSSRAQRLAEHRQGQVAQARAQYREEAPGQLAKPVRKKGRPVSVKEIPDTTVETLIGKREEQLSQVTEKTSPEREAALRHDRDELLAERARRLGIEVPVSIDSHLASMGDRVTGNRSVRIASEPSQANSPIEEANPRQSSKAPMMVETRDGARFFVNPRGKTARADTGRAESSQRTFYVAPADARKLAVLLRSEAGDLKRATVLPDGRVALQYALGPKWGQIVPDSAVRVLEVPMTGAVPVEILANGRPVQTGNPVDRIQPRGVRSPAIGVGSAASRTHRTGSWHPPSIPAELGRSFYGPPPARYYPATSSVPYSDELSGLDSAPPGRRNDQDPWGVGRIDLGELHGCCHLEDPDSLAVQRHLSELSLLPSYVKELLRVHGVSIFLGDCRASELRQAIDDRMGHQLGGAGGYSQRLKRIYLGNGTSGSESVPLHEVGHAIGYITNGHNSDEFISAHLYWIDTLSVDYGWRTDYPEAVQVGEDIEMARLNRGRRESFAEIFAVISKNGRKAAIRAGWPAELVEIVERYVKGRWE